MSTNTAAVSHILPDLRSQQLTDLRQDLLNLIAKNITPRRDDVDQFFDQFWRLYPDYMPNEKMAELAGINQEAIAEYYSGERVMPVSVWRGLLVNAVYHINSTQLFIALGEV